MSHLVASELLLMYGVVERVTNILNSDIVREIESQSNDYFVKSSFQELKEFFSGLCVGFPHMYKRIHRFQNSKFRVDVDRLRTTAYEIEDTLDLVATKHLEMKVNPIRDSLLVMFLPARPRSVDFHSELKSVLLKVKVIRDALCYNGSEEDTIDGEESEVMPAYRGFTDMISIDEAGSKERIADNWFNILPAIFSYLTLLDLLGSSKETDHASCHNNRLWCWEDTIVGRESEKKQIIDWIFNPCNEEHPNIISVCGAQGIGKTTLAKMIYNHIQASTRFELVLWAFTCNLDLKSTIVQIIRSFDNRSWFHLQRMDMKSLKDALRAILACKKYLLVLDGVGFGQLGRWEELREILEAGSTGSTIILVMSLQWSAESEMIGGKRFTLEGLPDEDSWSLFTRCAGIDDESAKTHPFLDPIWVSIANKCHGCPLAIKTMGSTLRNTRDEQTWKQIDESEIWSTSSPLDTASVALAISFHNMPFELVQCFVASAVLPENKVISRDRLVHFWMAQGLLQSRVGSKDLRDIGDRNYTELLLRAFLQLYPSDCHSTVLLHSRARYLAHEMQQKADCLLQSSFCENGRHFVLNEDDRNSLDNEFLQYHQKLLESRTFLFKDYVGHISRPFLEGLISKLRLARVLLLDGSEFEELPETIGNLRLLRYLSLAGNHILKGLPHSICKLVNLQTLDLSGCEQLEFIPDYMHYLANLRHLFLSLKLTHVPAEVLKSSRTSLQHLKISNSPNLNLLSKRIGHLTALRVLQIHDCPSLSSLPNSIRRLTFLTELSILNCNMLDLTKWDGLYGMRRLQFLQFQGLPKLSKFPEGLKSAAGSLRHLIVRNCENLTALPKCLEKCTILLEVVINNCPNMVTLPKGIHEIKTLQVWKIINCPKLVASSQSVTGEDTQHSSTSTLDEHPASPSDETRLNQEGPEVQFVECPEAIASLQEELHVQGKADGDMLAKSRDVEEMKDNCPILSLLPENYEIEMDTLIQLWMAGEYIKDEPMELQGEKLFNEVFKNGYLLRTGTNFMTGKDKYGINTKKINELIVSQKDIENFYFKWDNEYQKRSCIPDAESIQHVSLVCSDIDETIFQRLQQFSKLKTLLYLGNHGRRVNRIPDQLFSSFKNLQALDLSRTHIKELPSSVRDMVQLRYLDLSWTLIEWLPEFICSLVELQTLKLRGCSNLHELPGQLNKLTKLRHLDVDVLCQLKTMPRGVGTLLNLRTLSAFVVGDEDECRIQELKELNNLAGNFCIAKLENVKNEDAARDAALCKKEHLEKLELRWTPSEVSRTHINSDAILEHLKPCTTLEELQIVCYEGSALPLWTSDPEFNKLVGITFYKCVNVLELPLIEQLPFLKHLDLIKMNSVKKIVRRGKLENDIAFAKLETLEIDEMQTLESWHWKKKNDGDFVSLSQLIINDCPELKEFDVLPYLSSIKHFEIRECPKLQSLSSLVLPDSLDELIVEDCPQLQKKLTEQGGEDWYKIVHVPNKSIQ